MQWCGAQKKVRRKLLRIQNKQENASLALWLFKLSIRCTSRFIRQSNLPSVTFDNTHNFTEFPAKSEISVNIVYLRRIIQ